MTISNISSSTDIYQTSQINIQNRFKQRKHALDAPSSALQAADQNVFRGPDRLPPLDALSSALQAGDLSGAQKAFNALQELLADSPFGNKTLIGQLFRGKNPLDTDMDAMAQVLQSGDLKRAKETLTKLQQDLQATPEGNHLPKVPESAQNSSASAPTDAARDSVHSPSLNITA